MNQQKEAKRCSIFFLLSMLLLLSKVLRTNTYIQTYICKHILELESERELLDVCEIDWKLDRATQSGEMLWRDGLRAKINIEESKSLPNFEFLYFFFPANIRWWGFWFSLLSLFPFFYQQTNTFYPFEFCVTL